jgi:hypothetical protein
MKEILLKLPSVCLTAKRTIPQWANYRELPLNGERVQSIYCHISTASDYFRFGFKLLTTRGKLFGDGSIQSQDTNLVIHVGRNMKNREVFLTTYRNGVRESYDKVLFKTETLFMVASVSISIDQSNQLLFKVRGRTCYECTVLPEICYRAVMLAWGDHSDYTVDVSNLTLTTNK